MTYEERKRKEDEEKRRRNARSTGGSHDNAGTSTLVDAVSSILESSWTSPTDSGCGGYDGGSCGD
jgi:hypothetical protein